MTQFGSFDQALYFFLVIKKIRGERNKSGRRRLSSLLVEKGPMTALVQSLPGWAIAVAVIGLAAAMVYILFGQGVRRD
jgi:hypothetical protein